MSNLKDLCATGMDSRIATYALFLAMGMIMLASLVAPEVAQAITAPATGDFAYDLYDIGVNDILKGPVGFLGGLGAIVAGCIFLIKQNFVAGAPCVLGGGGLIKADTMVSSLGMLC